AAPADGWAAVRWQTPASDRLEVIVEDSGPGPSPSQREHLFDPFYSSREAGRSRGLGLPTAWRLTQEQGGSLCLDPSTSATTRFILTLPKETKTATAHVETDRNGDAPH